MALQKSGVTTINAALVLLALAHQPTGMRTAFVARGLRLSAQTAQAALTKLHSLRLVKRTLKNRSTFWSLSVAGSNLLAKHTAFDPKGVTKELVSE